MNTVGTRTCTCWCDIGLWSQTWDITGLPFTHQQRLPFKCTRQSGQYSQVSHHTATRSQSKHYDTVSSASCNWAKLSGSNFRTPSGSAILFKVNQYAPTTAFSFTGGYCMRLTRRGIACRWDNSHQSLYWWKHPKMTSKYMNIHNKLWTQTMWLSTQPFHVLRIMYHFEHKKENKVPFADPTIHNYVHT